METNKEPMEAPADLGGDIFDLIREWAHRPEGQRGEVARSIIGVLNRSYMAGVKDTRELFALSQRSEAVPAPSDEMVIRGAEVLHDSLRHAGCAFDFDHSLKGTEIQQGIAEAVFNAMIEVMQQKPAPAPSAAAGEQVPYGYVARANDGHETYFKERPTGFDNEKWKGLITVVPLFAAQPTPAQGDAVPVVDPPYEFARYSLDYINKRKPELSGQKVAEMIKRGWAGYEGDIWRAATRQSSTDAVDAARYLKEGETLLQRLKREIKDSEALNALLAKERARFQFLHSTNKDADGWEWGVARIRVDDDGRVEYLWGASDHSDIDAAIAAQGGKGGA